MVRRDAIPHQHYPVKFTRHVFDRWHERFPRSGSVKDAYERAELYTAYNETVLLVDGVTGARFPVKRKNAKWVVITVLPNIPRTQLIPDAISDTNLLLTARCEMPQVNNLMNAATPAVPAAGQPPVANPPAAPNPTAVAPAFGALSPAAQAMLQHGPMSGLPKIAVGPVGAYIGSAHPLARNWASLQAAGVQDGDFYLDGAGAGVVKLSPFKYWLYAVAAFCTRIDDNGNVLAATDDVKVIENRAEQERLQLQQHFVTVVLADTGSTIVPAKADFRHTKSGAVSIPKQAFDQAADPNWPRQSDAHRVAAQFPYPFGRVYCTAVPVPKQVRGGPNKGKRYFAAQATAVPTPLSDLERLGKAIGEPGFVDSLNQAIQNYTSRCDVIRAAIGKNN